MKEELTFSQIEQRKRLKDLYSGVFVVTVGVWVLRFVFRLLIGLIPESAGFVLLTGLRTAGDGTAVFLPFFLMRKAMRDRFTDLFRKPEGTERPAASAVVGCLAAAGIAFALTGAGDLLLRLLDGAGLHSAAPAPDLGNGAGETAFAILFPAVVLSFAYEIAFRGVAFGAMRDDNRFCAWLVSSLAFAFCDGDPRQIPVRLGTGFLIGAFCLREQSLWACIALQAAAQIGTSLWWIVVPEEDPFASARLIPMAAGLLVGIAATLFLFLSRRAEKGSDPVPRPPALKLLFSSFGIWLMVGLTAFSLLINVFFTDSDPADPLLDPTPQSGRQEPLRFDREQEFRESTEDPAE